MSDEQIWVGPAYGYALPTGTPKDSQLATVWPDGMQRAGKGAVRRARQLYRERDESEFDFRDDNLIVERKTKEVFKRAIFDAIGVSDAKGNGVECFVERDGWLIFLMPRDFRPDEQSVQMGTIIGRQVS